MLLSKSYLLKSMKNGQLSKQAEREREREKEIETKRGKYIGKAVVSFTSFLLLIYFEQVNR
jgi:hypothetical protein